MPGPVSQSFDPFPNQTVEIGLDDLEFIEDALKTLDASKVKVALMLIDEIRRDNQE